VIRKTETDKHSNLHVASFQPLEPPSVLKEEYPLTEESYRTVSESRETIARIVNREDPRLLAVVGPCSIHDTRMALQYAEKLKTIVERLADRIFVVMRVYFEKPRTKLGWRGLILDPRLDGSHDIQAGLRTARDLLLKITGMGVPAGSEMLDPIVPQFIDDLISWASIGARTTESQTHRDMASGLSMPIGFKNGTDGSIETAVNAFASSVHPHSFIGIDHDGMTCVVRTTGNRHGHIILRGGRDAPNYHDEQVEDTCELMAKAGLTQSIMIDCSHGNSRRDHKRQKRVLHSVVRQRSQGQKAITGFMLESNLFPGRQDIPEDIANLVYGVSITDACIGWEETEELLHWAYENVPSCTREAG
jgi:3-deoxy-7-phosphoheptulonate synthase